MTVIINGTTGIDTVQDGIITNAKIASMAATKLTGQVPDANAPSGSVVQVVQTVKTDAFAGSAGTVWGDVSGMTASITPASASNRILIIVDMKGAGGANYSVIRSRLLRDSTPIYVGDAASNRPRSMGQFYGGGDGGTDVFHLAQLGGTFLDSPATTSSITYKIQIGGDGNSQVVFINRTQGDRDNTYFDSRVAASITLIEIAA
jgi:hypothetical protein